MRRKERKRLKDLGIAGEIWLEAVQQARRRILWRRLMWFVIASGVWIHVVCVWCERCPLC